MGDSLRLREAAKELVDAIDEGRPFTNKVLRVRAALRSDAVPTTEEPLIADLSGAVPFDPATHPNTHECPWCKKVHRFDRDSADSDTAPLDVRRVKQAVTNIAFRHGVAKDPPPPDWSLMHLYGYSAAPAVMDAEIAAEYARLAASTPETPEHQEGTR